MSEQTSDQLMSFDPGQSRVDVKARRRYVLTADARGKSDGAYHTDLAKMLAQHCRKRLRYVGKQWARFDGQRWVIDGEDVAAYREWQELRPRIQFEFTDDEGKGSHQAHLSIARYDAWCRGFGAQLAPSPPR